MNDIRKVLSYNDVCLSPRHSNCNSTKNANLEIYYEYLPDPFTALPISNAPMDTVCSKEMIDFLHDNHAIVTIHRFFNSVYDQTSFLKTLNIKTDWNRLFVAVGSFKKHKSWIDTLLEARKENFEYGILVDMANGDTQAAIETVKYIRRQCNYINIMAGNVATKSGCEHLAEAGANLIRVGIGGGSICSTRLKTGFGVPVLTSVFDCAQAKPHNVYIIADGGIEETGDICKAMAAGADAVMCGKLFAATSLSAGKKVDLVNQINSSIEKWVKYHGMASEIARAKLNRTSCSIEGVEGLIPYQGDTKKVFNDVLQNLKSAMTYYAGVTNWRDFYRKTKFVEITSNGLDECRTRVEIKK